MVKMNLEDDTLVYSYFLLSNWFHSKKEEEEEESLINDQLLPVKQGFNPGYPFIFFDIP